MPHDFSVIGHGWLKKLYYNVNDNCREAELPGGGMMLSAMMAANGCDVAETELDEPERFEIFAADARTIAGKTRLSVMLRLGFTGGNPLIWDNLDADAFAVWDEGFWGIGELPEQKPLLWISKAVLPQAESYGAVKDNAALLLDAQAFRMAGFDIPESDAAAAARAVRTLLLSDERLAHLKGTRYIIVTFGTTAAVEFRLSEEGGYETLLTAARFSASEFMDMYHMPDAFTAFAAEVAAVFPRALAGEEYPAIAAAFEHAGAVAAMGYDPDGEITSTLSAAPLRGCYEITDEDIFFLS